MKASSAAHITAETIGHHFADDIFKLIFVFEICRITAMLVCPQCANT